MARSAPVPLENVEHKNFVRWCGENDIKVHHSANEKFVAKGLKHLAAKQNAIAKAMGQSEGFPDLLVALRPDQTIDGKGILLAVEMKRIRGSQTSEAQKRWIQLLENCGIPSRICYGAEAAKIFVGNYIFIVPKFNDNETF